MAITSRATAIRPTRSGRAANRSANPASSSNHTAGLIGLLLACAGLALLIALASYDPHDPSLNTASSRETRNLVGPAGAARCSPICCCKASASPPRFLG